MEKGKREIIGISVTALITVLLALFILPASAAATTVSIGSGEADPGESVTVPLMIYDVTGVAGVELNLTYDPSVVIPIHVTNSDFLLPPYDPPVDPESGSIYITAGQIFAGLDGDVKICDVELSAVGEAGQSSPLNLEDITLQDIGMVDIPVDEVINGTFTIPLIDTEPPIVTEPTATPSLISNDGTTFSTLSVNVTDASNISTVSIDLRPIGKSITTMSGPYPGSGTYYTTTNTSVTPGTYNLRVRAIDELGFSNTSVNITLKVIDRVPISIESVSAEPGGSVISQIMVSGVTALSPIDSCIVYTVYDKSVVEVSDVADGDFDDTVPTIANPYGVTLVSAEQTVSAGLTGEVVVAYITFTAVGAMGSSSSLELDKTGPAPIAPPVLKNPEGEDIPYTVVNGEFTVEAEDTDPPIVTSPTATPTLIPDDTDNNPTCSGTPYSETSQLNVTVTDESIITGVTIDLSAIGGDAAQVMTPVGDNEYSWETNASAGTAPGTYDLLVNATDEYGNSNATVSIRLTVMKNGDVSPYPDGDGKVDFLGDAMYLVRYANGVSGYTDIHLNIADVTGDCKVDFLGDAMYLVRYANGVSGYDILR